MNLTTTVHAFSHDIETQEGKKAWLELLAQRKADGFEPFETWSKAGTRVYWMTGHKLDGRVIELETAHLFVDQWNSAPIPGFSEEGYRLHDFALDANCVMDNKTLKTGYWLEQSPAMREARASRIQCGYCGKQYARIGAPAFCARCLDSEYLKETDLRLLRLVGLADERATLTDDERATLLHAYREAQKHGTTERGKARVAKAKADIETRHAEDIARAKQAVKDADTRRDAARWIIENMPGMLSQWIFYTHTQRHCFGWRDKGLSPEQVSVVLDVISEFPFAYEIVCADGRKLSGD